MGLVEGIISITPLLFIMVSITLKSLNCWRSGNQNEQRKILSGQRKTRPGQSSVKF